jgi:hypothetical protein
MRCAHELTGCLQLVVWLLCCTVAGASSSSVSDFAGAAGTGDAAVAGGSATEESKLSVDDSVTLVETPESAVVSPTAAKSAQGALKEQWNTNFITLGGFSHVVDVLQHWGDSFLADTALPDAMPLRMSRSLSNASDASVELPSDGERAL